MPLPRAWPFTSRTARLPHSRRWHAAAIGTILLLALLSGGCARDIRQWARNGFKLGPNFTRPPAPVAPAWLDSDNPEFEGAPICDRQWWTTFGDPTLDELIETARLQNLDLRVACTRILEARGQRNIAVGNLFPQSQSAAAAYTRAQITDNLPGQLSQIVPNNFDFWDVGFNLSWELDFWGRYRRKIETADAQWAASIEEYGDTLVLMFSAVANSYVQLRTFEERLRYARHNVEIQKGSLNLAEKRFQGGMATELDMCQARTSLFQTESVIPPLEAGRRQASNRLCILLGMPVMDLAAELEPAPIPQAPPKVAVGIPADLLRQRPDVRRAEQQVAVQSAQIGVAQADLYPRLALDGFLGYASSEIDSLFTPKSLTGYIIPTVQWNILNYGRIANNIAVHDARLQGAALQYQQTVLKAGREVEDALVKFLKAQQQTARLEQSVRDAERSVELVLIQFGGGVTDFNRVYNTQIALVNQQDQLAVARGEIALNLIQIYKALGGGWKRFIGGSRVPPVEGVEKLPPPLQPDENLPPP